MKIFPVLIGTVLLAAMPAVFADSGQDTAPQATENTASPSADEAEQAVIDADYDDVPDDRDKCLNTPLVKKIDPEDKFAAIFPEERRSPEPKSVPVDADGCALDTDQDGVPDYQDFCPEDSEQAISAGVHENGCPLQSDGDGTPDYRDNCPGTERGVATDKFGCPK